MYNSKFKVYNFNRSKKSYSNFFHQKTTFGRTVSTFLGRYINYKDWNHFLPYFIFMAHTSRPSSLGDSTVIPEIAWPTIILFTVCFGVWLSSIYLSIGINEPRKLTIHLIINTLCVYGVFTPMHDASHGMLFDVSSIR